MWISHSQTSRICRKTSVVLETSLAFRRCRRESFFHQASIQLNRSTTSSQIFSLNSFLTFSIKSRWVQDIISGCLQFVKAHHTLLPRFSSLTQGLIISSPEQARALFSQNPQLCYALFQSMLMLNLVDPNVLQRMIVPGSSGSNNVPQPMGPSNLQGAQQAGPASSYGAPTQQQGPPPTTYGGPPPPQQQAGGPPPRGYNQPPAQYGQPQTGGYPPMPGNFPMPPQSHQGQAPPSQPPSSYNAPAPSSFPGMPSFPPQPQGYGGAPQSGGYSTPPPSQHHAPAPAAPQQQGGPLPTNPEQQALLQQVLSMSQQQIDLLPPDQRQTVMAIVSGCYSLILRASPC